MAGSSIGHVEQGVEAEGTEEPKIDSISVTTTRVERATKDVPSAISVIDSEQIEGAKMMNIKDAVQGIPGIFIDFLAQFTGTVRTGACWAAPDSERRIPMKVRRNMKACLLCVSVASM